MNRPTRQGREGGAAPTLYVEFDPPDPCPHALAGDTADLVYFLSFAFSARYRSTHELSRASLLLRGEYRIDLGPLCLRRTGTRMRLTFDV